MTITSKLHNWAATIVLMNNIDFTKNLVKGRIAETVFAQMLRDAGGFTVLEFGYEKVIPELVRQTYDHNNPVVEALRAAPDFAVINQETKEVHLIEVKYRHRLDAQDVLNCANKMHSSWSPSYLFLATPDGFYLDEVSKIIESKGAITRLTDNRLPNELQEQYLEILRKFEQNN